MYSMILVQCCITTCYLDKSYACKCICLCRKCTFWNCTCLPSRGGSRRTTIKKKKKKKKKSTCVDTAA